MSHNPVIEVTNLRQAYGDFVAVNDISFTVQPGEVFALLGTNGAGKTTTMDVLEGFLKATSGHVRVLGHNPHTERRKIANEIGILLQEAGFFQELTVAETIDAWRRFTRRPVSRAEALSLVALESKANTRVRRLSGGERRRLDLALAVLGRPRLLFLDEPTTGLDPEARRQTWHFLKQMVSEGMTVLLTTHYMEEAEFLADRVAIMDHGRIARQGAVADVVSQNTDTRISFAMRGGYTAAHLPVLPGAEVYDEGDHVELVTKHSQRVLKTVLDWADHHGVQLHGLEVRVATLEDVFLGVAASGKANR
jgi:ABC-2 type transport system ATP-binding protein